MVILLERINIQTVSTSGKQANGFLQTVACPTLTSDRGEVYFQRYDKIRQWNFVSWSDSPVTIIRKDMYIFLNPQLGVEECGSQPGDFTANTASDHLVSYKIIFIFWCFSCDSSKSLLMFLLFISSTSMDTGVQQRARNRVTTEHWFEHHIYAHLKGKSSRAQVINPQGLWERWTVPNCICHD